MSNVFINDAVFINNHPAKISYEKDAIRMSIMNLYNVFEVEKEYVKIEIPNTYGIIEGFNRNFLCSYSELVVKENNYIFKQGDNLFNDGKLYILVRAPKYSFGSGDVYISNNDRNRVKVLKQFKFIENCVASEEEASKMYFAKVNLPPKSGFTVYFSTVKSKYKVECIEFFNSSFFGICFKKGVSLLGVDEETENMYISLSELESNKI